MTKKKTEILVDNPDIFALEKLLNEWATDIVGLNVKPLGKPDVKKK